MDKHMAEMDLCGGAYMLGRMNGDHWYLYALDAPDFEKVFIATNLFIVVVVFYYLYYLKEVETTFEVLMSDLDHGLMKQHFYCDSPVKDEQRKLGRICTNNSGIGDLLKGICVFLYFVFVVCVSHSKKGATLDESMFYPCGYSMNGAKVM